MTWRHQREVRKRSDTVKARRFARQGEEAIERVLGGLSLASPPPMLNDSEEFDVNADSLRTCCDRRL